MGERERGEREEENAFQRKTSENEDRIVVNLEEKDRKNDDDVDDGTEQISET